MKKEKILQASLYDEVISRAKNFLVWRSESLTTFGVSYTITSPKRRVLVENVVSWKAVGDRYMQVKHKDGTFSLYNDQGPLAHASHVKKEPIISSKGIYTVYENGKRKIYDAEKWEKIARSSTIVGGLISLGALFSFCVYQGQKDFYKGLEQQSTYLGQQNGKHCFDTDGDFSTVEFYGDPHPKKSQPLKLHSQQTKRALWDQGWKFDFVKQSHVRGK